MLWSYMTRWYRQAQYSISNNTIGSDGDIIVGTPTVTDITIITPQPLKPKDVDYLEEGQKIRDHWLTWTNTTPPDDSNCRLIYKNITYRVTSIDDRTDTAGAYKLIIKKELYN